MNSDDTLPSEYPYAWSPSSQLSLEEFLTKYKPSMVQDDGTKPWLWVEKSAYERKDNKIATAVEEAAELLKDVTAKVEEIKNDDAIPVRANKKKGTKSKKEVREAVQSEATEKLKDISIRNGFVSGKWLIFAPTDKVDMVWSTIAKSLISGPLASTRADLAKVATCPKNEVPNYSHVLCLYVPNVYDKDDVTEIMKILLRKHGMNLMGVKSNLYTAIGLDSKHPSGIPSTVWKNAALLPEAEIKGLKDEYFAELNVAKSGAVEKAATGKAATGAAEKAKPKLKKKAEDDPFASDEDSKEMAPTRIKEQAASSSKPMSKKAVPKAKKATRRDDSGSDEDGDREDSDEAVRKTEVAKKKATASTGKSGKGLKRAKTDEDEEDEDAEAQPRKRQARK